MIDLFDESQLWTISQRMKARCATALDTWEIGINARDVFSPALCQQWKEGLVFLGLPQLACYLVEVTSEPGQGDPNTEHLVTFTRREPQIQCSVRLSKGLL